MRRGALVLTGFLLALAAVSPLVAAAEESELNAEYLWDQFVKFFNLSLVILVMFFLLRGPVKKFFKERGQQIDLDIAAAQAAREEAERQMEDVKSRVSGLRERIVEIEDKAREEGAAEKARIIATAKRESKRIVQGAEREIENRVKAARQELRRYTADLSVKRARELLRERLREDDDRRLIKRSLEDIRKVGLK